MGIHPMDRPSYNFVNQGDHRLKVWFCEGEETKAWQNFIDSIAHIHTFYHISG